MVECDLVEAYFEINGFLARKNHKPGPSLPEKTWSHFLSSLFLIQKLSRPRGNWASVCFQRSDASSVCRSDCFGLGKHFLHQLSLNSDAKLLKFLKQEIDPERLGFNDSLIDDDSLSADGLMKVMVVPALPAGLDR